jgi:hypothetical protein
LRSRTGVRWIAALIATSLVFFMVWAYNNDASLGLVGSSAPSLQNLPLIGGNGKRPPSAEYPAETGSDGKRPPSAESPATTGGDGKKPDNAESPAETSANGSSIARPAWISTPAPFDASQLPDLTAAAVEIDASSALHPLVADAMARFLQRPVLTHKQAAAQNEVACPRAQLGKQVNADQLNGDRQKWLAVDEDTILEMRRAALNFMESRSVEEGADALIGPGFGPDGKAVQKGSRGVVIAAGNRRTVDSAVICIKEVQRLGWNGRIEVWHFSGELEDKKDQQALKDLGVDIHTVSLGSGCCQSDGD